MRVIIFSITCLFFCFQTLGWGPTGHRVVGQIAENHLSKKVLKQVRGVLGFETLAEVSNFMDDIKSDADFRHLSPWHYCTIPKGMTYAEVGVPEEGDILFAIDKIVKDLKSGTLSNEDEAFWLKCLVHLVGDLHQPLHVGNGEDRGGNDVKLEYFWEPSNLHRVWDSGIIDEQQLSYLEYTNWIDHPTQTQIESWQKTKPLEWALESQSYHEQVYQIPENGKLSYGYNYENRDTVNQRLLQAGIRLAGILTEIYG